jgi:hypothetical protein
VDVRRLVFLSAVEMKSVGSDTQNRRHDGIFNSFCKQSIQQGAVPGLSRRCLGHPDQPLRTQQA